jgi:hypothetical protein
MSSQFLFRTIAADEAGDPYDFGVVVANDLDHACVLLGIRFDSLRLDSSARKVWIAPLKPRDIPGVRPAGPSVVRTIH